MRNIRKETNHTFVSFQCSVCLDLFEGDDPIYAPTYMKNEVVCYVCAKEPEEKIIKRIDKKIAYLREQQAILRK